MIVVAGNDQHWDFHRADGSAGRRHRRLGGMRRIKHVAGDQDEGGARGIRHSGEALHRMQALLLQAVALRIIADRGKRFAKLPVCGVKEYDAHTDHQEEPADAGKTAAPLQSPIARRSASQSAEARRPAASLRTQ